MHAGRRDSSRAEKLQAFGERLMPILAEVGIEFAGEPDIFEVHNAIKC